MRGNIAASKYSLISPDTRLSLRHFKITLQFRLMDRSGNKEKDSSIRELGNLLTVFLFLLQMIPCSERVKGDA